MQRRLLLILIGLATLLQAANHDFYLTIDDAYLLSEPDGTTLPAWAFQLGGDNVPPVTSIPGPVLDVVQSGPDSVETIFIHFHNTSEMPQTLHIQGGNASVSNDGFPGVTPEVAPDESAVYTFSVNSAGNYAYVALSNAPLARQMGLYGLIHVHAAAFHTHRWFITIGIDPNWHSDPAPADLSQYAPSLIQVSGYVASSGSAIDHLNATFFTGDPIEVSLFNPDFWPQVYYFPPGVVSVVTADGRLLYEPITIDSLTVYPGERYGLGLLFTDTGEYSFGMGIKNPLTGQNALAAHWEYLVIDGSTLRGDINEDGVRNVQDLIIMVDFILGNSLPTPVQLYLADINNNGTLDITDVVMLVNLILGQ